MLIPIILVFAFGIGFWSVDRFGNDNPIEEVAEEVIDASTGDNVNLDKTKK